MPIYEFRCKTCDERFELRRPMRDADASATCASGHDDVVRLLPTFSMTGTVAGSDGCAVGGGCCGGLCASA